MTEPRLVSSGSGVGRTIALTFDDGPSRTTPAILDILEAHDVRATFFVVGEWVERMPDIVRDTAARGHEIGNHTWSHVDANRVRELATLVDEVERTNDAIERAIGSAPAFLRPPFGSDAGRLARAGAACGLAATVLWSVESFDWRGPDDPQAIVEQVLADVEPGAIVLLHDGQYKTNDAAPRQATLAALPLLLERLRSERFSFATVSELVGA